MEVVEDRILADLLIGMYRAGAFAEKIAIPERNLIPVPDGIPSAHAALTEPGATGLHAFAELLQG